MTETSLDERFKVFYKSFKEGEKYKYREQLAQLSATGSQSLVVDFTDLNSFDHPLAKQLINSPERSIDYAKKAAYEQLKIEDPEYAEEIEEVFVRFQNLTDVTPVREIRSDTIGKLVLVDGIVIRASPVNPLMVKGAYKCLQCGSMIEVPQKEERTVAIVPKRCNDPNCKGRNFSLVPSESKFINVQSIRLQERPEELPPGQLPCWIDVKLRHDLVDTARPGDRIFVTALVRAVQLRSKMGGRLRVFNLDLDANYVDVSAKRFESIEITPDEEEKIRKLARDPFIIQKLIRSIAPSIYGYDYIKESILYLLCSGVSKSLPDLRIRGNIHVLLIGDPGTAKSQLLRYVDGVAPRALYTSGRGSTAAGLTAAVLRDKEGGMMLEAGALVLADRGICAIDEFDKMNVRDRTSIHEAMEQQTVSVAKGGIIAILNARSSIVAAANPKLGRYDPRLTVTQNVNLPPTILSRFDLIFVIRDVPRMAEDEKMARHIAKLHMKETVVTTSVIPQDILAKYVAYARTLNPVLTNEAANRLEEFFLRMRMQSESSPESPVAITPRQLESLIRLAEARAKANLRDRVTLEDAEAAINLYKTSLRQVGIDITTGKYDIDIIMTGKPKSQQDKMRTVLSVVGEGISDSELYQSLSEYGIERDDAERYVQELVRDGLIYQPRPSFYKKV